MINSSKIWSVTTLANYQICAPARIRRWLGSRQILTMPEFLKGLDSLSPPLQSWCSPPLYLQISFYLHLVQNSTVCASLPVQYASCFSLAWHCGGNIDQVTYMLAVWNSGWRHITMNTCHPYNSTSSFYFVFQFVHQGGKKLAYKTVINATIELYRSKKKT